MFLLLLARSNILVNAKHYMQLFSVNCLCFVHTVFPSGSFWARNSFLLPGYKVIPWRFLRWFRILHLDPIWNLSWCEMWGVDPIMYFPMLLQHYLLRNVPFQQCLACPLLCICGLIFDHLSDSINALVIDHNAL